MITTAYLRSVAQQDRKLEAQYILEIADFIDSMERRAKHLIEKVQQLEAKVAVLTGMNTLAFAAAGSARKIEEIAEEVKSEGTNKNSQLYNAFEVRQLIYAYEHALESGRDWKEAYDKGKLERPVKNNIKEVFDAIKAGSEQHFYLSEIRLVRTWGQDHERNADHYKRRFGKAFTDPVGYMDENISSILPTEEKKELRAKNVIASGAFPHGVYRRPTFLHIPDDWKICDGDTQFHAGEHFHTRQSSGLWWCGTLFQDLSAAQLALILETTLAELRLLYSHYPEGIKNATPTA